MSQFSPVHEITQEAGAIFDEQAGWNMPGRFGDPATEYQYARSSVALFDASNRGKVEVTGKDAATFLHNLCTNDIENMPLGAGCETFFCTARAKVVAHAFIFHLLLPGNRHAFWLDVAPGQTEKLIQHLDRFIISEQVEIADRTNAFCQVHLAGPNSKAILERALADEIPDLELLQHMERTFGANVHAHIRRNDLLGVPGYDIVCLSNLGPGLWRMLSGTGAKPAGLEAYEILRVEAGTPVYGVDIDENRFAFDVGRTAQAISYEKGCYLGQEPIVMARDRAGHAPRTLMGLKLSGSDLVPRETKVFQGSEDVGFVTSSVKSPRFGVIALAYVRFGHQTPGLELKVATSSGPQPATVSPLPFNPM
jgi:folate-binding protein YgfZ